MNAMLSPRRLLELGSREDPPCTIAFFKKKSWGSTCIFCSLKFFIEEMSFFGFLHSGSYWLHPCGLVEHSLLPLPNSSISWKLDNWKWHLKPWFGSEGGFGSQLFHSLGAHLKGLKGLFFSLVLLATPDVQCQVSRCFWFARLFCSLSPSELELLGKVESQAQVSQFWSPENFQGFITSKFWGSLDQFWKNKHIIQFNEWTFSEEVNLH